jgi:hypothetical protein
MIDFKELLEYCQVEAISSKVSPTEESVWRSLCRDYSIKFHTPLMDVLLLDPEHVVLNVYELQAETMDTDDYQRLERIMDTLLGIEDPNYEAKKNKEQEEFDRQAELEEEERIKAGRPVYQPKKKTLLKNDEVTQKKLPTGGMVNLDYLSKQDSES